MNVECNKQNYENWKIFNFAVDEFSSFSSVFIWFLLRFRSFCMPLREEENERNVNNCQAKTYNTQKVEGNPWQILIL